MSRFYRLLRKDLEASRWPLVFLSGITVGIMLFVRHRVSTGAWPPTGAIAAVVIPLTFLPLWLMWQSFQTLRSEWREDTVYTLLVLPVPGWQIMLSKLVSIWVEYTVLLAVTLGGTLLFFWGMLEDALRTLPSVSWAVSNGLLIYLASLAILASFVIFVQLAFVVGKMVGRLQGIVAIWTLVLASWLVDKLGMLFEPLFRWIPSLPLHRLLRLHELGRDVTLEWNLAPEIGTWLGILALFWATSYLFEHYVEVNG